jgi:YmdB-like protein
MDLLMVGDVVGPEATAWLADRLPSLRREHAINLVIVSAENCALTAAHPLDEEWPSSGALLMPSCSARPRSR